MGRVRGIDRSTMDLLPRSILRLTREREYTIPSTMNPFKSGLQIPKERI